MSGRIIYNLPNPIGPNQPATKSFVENKINDYLKRDGSLNMTANLKMDKNYIEDLQTPIDVPITDLVNYRKDAYRAANKEYLRQNFLKRVKMVGLIMISNKKLSVMLNLPKWTFQ